MTSDVFSVLFSRDSGNVVVHVAGEVDMATAPALRDALHDVILDQGNLAVTVSLAHTTFMDSTGLNVMVSALKDLRARGGHMTVAEPSATVMRLLQLTGLTKIFDIVSSDDVGPAGPAPTLLQHGQDVGLAG